MPEKDTNSSHPRMMPSDSKRKIAPPERLSLEPPSPNDLVNKSPAK